MTKKQFAEQLAKTLNAIYKETEWDVKTKIVLKNNDTDHYGLILCRPGDTASPTIYIDEFYNDFLNKKSTIPEIAEQISTLVCSVRDHASLYEKMAFDLESCRNKIIYRLISYNKNKRLLQNIPHLPFLDFAITFHVMCRYTEEKGLETMRITNQLMENWNISVKDLFKMAKKNTPELFPPRIESLQDVLAGYLGQKITDKTEELPFPILMVSNRQGINGATVLLYENLIKNISAQFGGNLFLLPSSIHEFLLMPQAEEDTLEDLSRMVAQINHDQVRAEEVLSDHAYLYDSTEDKFYF